MKENEPETTPILHIVEATAGEQYRYFATDDPEKIADAIIVLALADPAVARALDLIFERVGEGALDDMQHPEFLEEPGELDSETWTEIIDDLDRDNNKREDWDVNLN